MDGSPSCSKSIDILGKSVTRKGRKRKGEILTYEPEHICHIYISSFRYIYNKELMSSIYKELLKLIKSRHKTEQQAKRHEQYFTE